MNAVVANNAANLVGITGIARRLVQDGSLAETVARKAMADAAAAKMPLAHWLNEKRLVSPAQMASGLMSRSEKIFSTAPSRFLFA